MINDNFALTGALTIAINNEVVQKTENLVVLVGKKWVANRLTDQSAPVTATAFVPGTIYTILTLGTTTTAQWNTAGVTGTAVVGTTFTATAVTLGTGTARSHTQKAEMSHMAIGTDTTPNSGATVVAAGDTALVTEADRNTLSIDGGVVTNNTITYECTWAAADGTGAITEAGIFNASTAGDMFARTKFAVVNKGALDSMTITWTITVS